MVINNQIAQTIKKKPTSESLDFNLLRNKGLEYLQEVSSNLWTDHNLHDPGITIMEAFIFALTEISSKANLPIRDLIANVTDDDTLSKLHPFLDDNIYFTKPLTSTDYKKIFADTIGISKGRLNINQRVDPGVYYSYPVPATPDGFLTFDPTVTTNAPLTTNPLGERVELKGINDLIIKFRDSELNDNIIGQEITINLIDYQMEIAIPYWDTAPSSWRMPISVDNLSLPNDIVYDDTEKVYIAGVRVEYNGTETYNFGTIIRFTSTVGEAPPDSALAITELRTIVGPGDIDPTPVFEQAILQFNLDSIRSDNFALHLEKKLNDNRNLTEDFNETQSERVLEIALDLDIFVKIGTDLDRLLCEIYFLVSRFLSNDFDFKKFQELSEDDSAELAALLSGPRLDNGFILDTDVEEQVEQEVLYVSDLTSAILAVNDSGPFALAILLLQNFRIHTYINNYLVDKDVFNCLRLPRSGNYRPKLSLVKSKVRFYEGEDLVETDFTTVSTLFQQKKEALPFPGNEFPKLFEPKPNRQIVENLNKHYSIQNDFPEVYGIKKGELPIGASAERNAQARQLRAYLSIFDQLLSNTTAELSNLGRLFSADKLIGSRDLIAPLYGIDNVGELLKAYTDVGGSFQTFMDDENNAYVTSLLSGRNSPLNFIEKRNAILNHLLARLGEQHKAYDDLMYGINLSGVTIPANVETAKIETGMRLTKDKTSLISDHTEISATRGKGFNYQGRSRKIEIFQLPDTSYHWDLLDDDEGILFSNLNGHATFEDAYLEASVCNRYASNPGFYRIDPLAPFAISIVDVETNMLGFCPAVFSSAAEAAVFQNQLIDSIRDIWNTENVSGLQKRVSRLLGFADYKRRNMVEPDPEAYFVIHSDGPVATPFLFSTTQEVIGGELTSGYVYTTLIDVQNGRDSAIISGIDSSNYQSLVVGNDLVITLLDSLTTLPLATIEYALLDNPDADLLIENLVNFFINAFGPQEGFYLLEHTLLRPVRAGDPAMSFLPLRLDDPELISADPYSFRLSVFLPEDQQATGVLAPIASPPRSRFENAEFRRFIEQTIIEECPSHIIVGIYWLNNADMLIFQTLYQDWLTHKATYLVDQNSHTQALLDFIAAVNPIIELVP